MEWTSLDSWIVVAGVLCAMACGILGNFLVLRRMSMMGDAISHAVLPGLAAAFLLTNSRGSLAMFAGAAIVGVLTAAFTQWIHHFGRMDQSASMGVVFTTLFAIGLIMIVRAADSVDLDPGCVLNGAIEFVVLDTCSVFGVELPRSVLILGVVFLVNVLFVVLFFKELRISCFDPELGTTMGINKHLMHYLLMILVAVTTVAAFESVGSILVVAMLILPAATAHLLTDRLHTMIAVSLVVAALSAALGHVAAITLPRLWGFEDTSTAGMMATVAGAIFALTMIAAPRHGVLGNLFHRLALGLRIMREDILGMLYRFEESEWTADGPVAKGMLHEALGTGGIMRWIAEKDLARRRLIVRTGEAYALTSSGRADARNVIRSHRLWESYLHKHLHLPVDHLHAPAEQLEHVTDSALQKRLAAEADTPELDPQGRQIPEGGRKDEG